MLINHNNKNPLTVEYNDSTKEEIRSNLNVPSKEDLNKYLPLTGGTVTGTLILSKTSDSSGISETSPALVIGGLTSTAHIEMDNNEIHAKTDGTTPTQLWLNSDGGKVRIGADGLQTDGKILAGGISSASYTGNGVITIVSAGDPIIGYTTSTVPSTYTLARWNGAYNDTGGSNLAYCNKGAFGSIVTRDAKSPAYSAQGLLYSASQGTTVGAKIPATGYLVPQKPVNSADYVMDSYTDYNAATDTEGWGLGSDEYRWRIACVGNGGVSSLGDICGMSRSLVQLKNVQESPKVH